MKKCPFCGEKLDDNARFCLYCMKSLEEKEKIVTKQSNTKSRLIFIFTEVALLVILIIVLFLCLHSCVNDSKGNIIEEENNNPVNFQANGDTSYSENHESPASSDMTNIVLPDVPLISQGNTESAVISSTPGLTIPASDALLPSETSKPTSENDNSSVQQNSAIPSNTGRPTPNTTVATATTNLENTTKIPGSPKKTSDAVSTTVSGSDARPATSNPASGTAVSTVKPQNTIAVTTTSSPKKTPIGTSATANTVTPSSTTVSTATAKPSNKPTTATTTTATAKPTATPEVIENITWYYYDLTTRSSEYNLIDLYGDDNTDNAIVICGFKNIASNGIYKIPDTIDGKIVVGLNMAGGVSQGYTFSSTDVINTVKKVYLPPRLIVVSSESTFTRCPNITDLYVSSEKLHIAKNYFPYYYDYKNASKNGFTFHSSENCIALYKDRNTTFKSLISSGSLYNGKFNSWDKSEQY